MRSRPTTSWSDLRNASVGVFGLGVEGGANVRRLRALGVIPVLVDDALDVEEVDGLEVLAGAEGREALARCDIVVKTPGISRYGADVRSLEQHGVAVAGGLGLWMQEARREHVACITGTKGKSTTTAIAGHLLAGLGREALVGGNFGLPPWDPNAGDGHDLWVIETSSFQVMDLAVAPKVSAVTSLSADHLDWHGDVETYFADKLSICTLPGAGVTVADGTSAEIRARASALGPNVEWVDDPPAAQWQENLRQRGAHNRRNAEIARRVLVDLGVEDASDFDALTEAAAGFNALPSRLQTLDIIDGVEFVDDSLSTNIAPALAALDAFAGQRVAILVGGYDRGLDYRPLARGLAARDLPTLVVTLPDSGPRIGSVVRDANLPRVETVDAVNLVDAATTGFAWCDGDGVVLLSPAAPSFGRFRDYRERAATFAEATRGIKSRAARSG